MKAKGKCLKVGFFKKRKPYQTFPKSSLNTWVKFQGKVCKQGETSSCTQGNQGQTQVLGN